MKMVGLARFKCCGSAGRSVRLYLYFVWNEVRIK